MSRIARLEQALREEVADRQGFEDGLCRNPPPFGFGTSAEESLAYERAYSRGKHARRTIVAEARKSRLRL